MVSVFSFTLAALLFVSEAQATSHIVTIETMKYSPETLTVHAKDTVTWMNKDLFPHTVTADNKSFDSKTIEAGKSWKYTAIKKGHFNYHCDLHMTMKAKLIVE
jgi:plastocyanin